MQYITEIAGELKSQVGKFKDKFTKTELQRKLKEATSNEHCHANVSLLNEISNMTHNYNDLEVITAHVSKKLNCRKEKWRKILKTLFLVEHLLKTGSTNFADSMRGMFYQLRNLNTFSYIDETRADKGETIREKSRTIMKLLEDRDLLNEERKNYSKWRTRIEGVGSGGCSSVSSSNWSSGNRMYGSTSSDNYVSSSNYGSSSYSSYKPKKQVSSKKEESSDSDSDDDKKKKKKKKKKSNDSDEDDEDESEKKKKKKKKKNDDDDEDQDDDDNENKNDKPSNKTQSQNVPGISIRKPGQKGNQQSNNQSNNNNQGGFDFDFGNNNSSSNNNTQSQSQNNFDFFFGGNSQPTNTNSTTTTNNNANNLNDIFGGFSAPAQNQPQQQSNNNNTGFFDFSVSNSNTNTNTNNNTAKDMFSFTQPTTSQPQQNSFDFLGGNNQNTNNNNSDKQAELLKNLSNLNNPQPQQPEMFNFTQQNTSKPAQNNMGAFGMQNNNNMFGMQNNNNMFGMQNNNMNSFGMQNNSFGMQNNPNTNNNQNFYNFFQPGNTQPKPQPQTASQPTFSFTTNTSSSNNNKPVFNDDDFEEVKETTDNSANANAGGNKGGLSNLLNSGLVDLGSLKSSGGNSNNKTSYNSNYNFY